jgi:uncharacterized membrane protein
MGMTLSNYLVAYFVTAIVFFGMDFVWLMTATSRFYRVMLGDLLLEKPNLLVAALFYFIYVGGIVILAVAPALHVGSWATALTLGAVLGLIAYGTYDFTNLATLKGWPAVVSVVDLAWGMSLTAIAATLGFLVVSKFGI